MVPIARELLFSPLDLAGFFKREQPDCIFHLAAYGNMASQKDLSMTFAANLTATFNMLKESLEVPYRAFVNFGSSSEYGRKSEAMSEQDVLAPETLYGAAKAGATHLGEAFAAQFAKPIFTVRPFSVYGPGEAGFRFIPTVIRSMLTGASFPLDEDANHDWIYIEDFVAAVLLLVERAPCLPAAHRVYNVGSGRMYSNKQVCETLKQVTGRDYRASPLSGLRRHDSAVWVSDNSRISSLGFRPRHSLAEGLEKTYLYYKEMHEAES